MLKPYFPSITLLFLACCLSAPTFAEDDASLHQVFQAAEAGNFKEAQSMMDNVLKNHPNSAKAHFVEAELLAKQGLNSNASAELSKAEQLDPKLTFAKPEALQSLKNRIAVTAPSVIPPSIAHQSAAPTMAMPKNWLMPVLLFVGLGVMILFIMALFRRNTQSLPANYPAYAPHPNNGPIGNPSMGSGMGPAMGQPAAGGGMASGLMGNLATGAALGAGVVAGEALMHHFIDGDHNAPSTQTQQPEHSPWSSPDNTDNNSSSNNYDMGGNDFGVQDSSSWDDDSSGDSDDDNWG